MRRGTTDSRGAHLGPTTRVGVAVLALAAAATGCGAHTGASSSSAPPSSAPASSPPAGGGAASATPAPVPTHIRARTTAWHLPYAVARAAVTSVDGTLARTLLVGGMLPGDSSTAQVTAVDPAAGRTHAAASLPVPVHDAAAGWAYGLPAVFGGGNSSEQSVVQTLGRGGWHAAAHLPTTRSDLSVVTSDRSSVVVGGYDGVHVPTDVLRPAAGGFRRIGSLREGVRYAATAQVGNSVYVLGGEVDHRELAEVQRLDLRTGRTRVVARLPRPLGHAVATPVGSRVLLLGGRTDPDTQTSAAWWFDPATAHFSRAGRLPVALSDTALVTGPDRVWLLGGESPAVTDRVVEVRWS
ncbi:MAG: Kelch repeat-containing protein [Marmoricola sp.]|nr:Kelch repeat-containing protein [Marmoricola sp.]